MFEIYKCRLCGIMYRVTRRYMGNRAEFQTVIDRILENRYRGILWNSMQLKVEILWLAKWK